MGDPITYQVPLSEAAILASCKRLLRSLHGQLLFRRIHVMPIAVGTNLRQFRANDDMQGMPDLVIMLPRALTLWVEVKSSRGALTVHQKKFMEQMRSIGHYYFVVRDTRELESILKQFGVKHWLLNNYDPQTNANNAGDTQNITPKS